MQTYLVIRTSRGFYPDVRVFSTIENAIDNIRPDVENGPAFYQENKKLDKKKVDAGLFKEYIYVDEVSKILDK